MAKDCRKRNTVTMKVKAHTADVTLVDPKLAK